MLLCNDFLLQILGKCTGNAFYKYYIFSLMKNYLEKCSLLRPKGLNPFQTFFRFFFYKADILFIWIINRAMVYLHYISQGRYLCVVNLSSLWRGWQYTLIGLQTHENPTILKMFSQICKSFWPNQNA